MTSLRCVDLVGFPELFSSGTLTSHPVSGAHLPLTGKNFPTKLIAGQRENRKCASCVPRGDQNQKVQKHMCAVSYLKLTNCSDPLKISDERREAQTEGSN